MSLKSNEKQYICTAGSASVDHFQVKPWIRKLEAQSINESEPAAVNEWPETVGEIWTDRARHTECQTD